MESAQKRLLSVTDLTLTMAMDSRTKRKGNIAEVDFSSRRVNGGNCPKKIYPGDRGTVLSVWEVWPQCSYVSVSQLAVPQVRQARAYSSGL